MKASGWKSAERRFAKAVGTRRKPVDGSRESADFVDAIGCYQVKVRRMLPAWLWSWLAGIQTTAKGYDKAGILVLKLPRQDDAKALVILSWKDWCDLHGSPHADTDDAA